MTFVLSSRNHQDGIILSHLAKRNQWSSGGDARLQEPETAGRQGRVGEGEGEWEGEGKREGEGEAFQANKCMSRSSSNEYQLGLVGQFGKTHLMASLHSFLVNSSSDKQHTTPQHHTTPPRHPSTSHPRTITPQGPGRRWTQSLRW